MKKYIKQQLIVAALSATILLPGVVVAEAFTVEIAQLKFTPEKLEVMPGDTVTWINRDIVPHTATANDRSWDTGEIKHSESKTITIPEQFGHGYFCTYHPSMRGEI